MIGLALGMNLPLSGLSYQKRRAAVAPVDLSSNVYSVVPEHRIHVFARSVARLGGRHCIDAVKEPV